MYFKLFLATNPSQENVLHSIPLMVQGFNAFPGGVSFYVPSSPMAPGLLSSPVTNNRAEILNPEFVDCSPDKIPKILTQPMEFDEQLQSFNTDALRIPETGQEKSKNFIFIFAVNIVILFK